MQIMPSRWLVKGHALFSQKKKKKKDIGMSSDYTMQILFTSHYGKHWWESCVSMVWEIRPTSMKMTTSKSKNLNQAQPYLSSIFWYVAQD